jgi:hypothetical protein
MTEARRVMAGRKSGQIQRKSALVGVDRLGWFQLTA